MKQRDKNEGRGTVADAFPDLKSNLERIFWPLPPDCGPVRGDDEAQRRGVITGGGQA